MKKYRKIKSLKYLFEISSNGELRNTKSKKIKVFNKDTKGYLRTRLSQPIVKSYSQHRLVAECWVSNPDNKPYINHINGIKDDNRACNLEWVTASENTIHAIESGLIDLDYLVELGSKLGNKHKQNLIDYTNSIKKVIICNETNQVFDCSKDVAIWLITVRNKNLTGKLSTVARTVRMICNGERKQIYGYTFKYL